MHTGLIIAAIIAAAVGVTAVTIAKRSSIDLAREWANDNKYLRPIWTFRQEVCHWATYLSLTVLTGIALYSTLVH